MQNVLYHFRFPDGVTASCAVCADGAINALIVLDLLAKALPYSIDEQLDDIKAIFLAASTPPVQA